MLRRYSMMRGDSDWASITESAARSTLWVEGQGQRWSYTYKNIKGSKVNGAANRTAQLINLLSTSPEGVVAYNSNVPHAVLITDYTGGVFYCADPLPGRPSGRIPLSQAYGFSNSAASATSFWYVTSPSISLTPSKPADTENPSISNVKITDINRDGYTITCNVSDNVGVDKVMFPTWLNSPGQEAKWYQGTLNGNTASYHVDINDIGGNEGTYFTHIYAYDNAGNYIGVGIDVYIDRTPAQIKDVKITDIDSTGYTVSCEVTDASGVDRVQFPTWTEYNGRDDLLEDWHVNPKSSGIRNGNTFSYRVNDSDHNFERGQYITHIHAYDAMGNNSNYGTDTNIQNKFQAKNSIVYNGHEYYLLNDLLSWTDAKDTCEKNGGYLATITTQAEQNVVMKLVSQMNREGYYIGGYDNTGINGPYRWVTGELFSYTNWAPSEPNNAEGIEHYLEIYSHDGKWNDNSYDSHGILTRGYIMEKVAIVSAREVSLSKNNLSFNQKGSTASLIATVLPANATNKSVTWKSSNTSVATISNSKVTAVGNGTANITVTTADGNKTATCKVTVKIPDPVKPNVPKVTAKSVSLNKRSVTLYKGKTYTLKAKVSPSNYRDGFSWSSSNRNTTVSNTGKLTANKAGKSTITVKTNNNKRAYCNVVVKEIKSKSVALNKKSITLYKGKKYTLKATIKPGNSTDGRSWSSSSKKYATVTSKGTITAIRKGSCTITVKTSSGKKAVCKVVIK